MAIPLMKCGHNGHAQDGDGKPCCIICHPDPRAKEIDTDAPDMTDRKARCAYGCGSEKPSSPDLPFFEYLGPGSRTSNEQCTCGMLKIAHDIPERRKRTCGNFTPKGAAEFDRYYCGCRGWD